VITGWKQMRLKNTEWLMKYWEEVKKIVTSLRFKV
jgi:hypothetical protein